MPVFFRNAAILIGISLCLTGCGFFGSSGQVGLEPPKNATGVVKIACTQMGAKYRPGGASPKKGFDCSGLVWWSYKQHGVDVPRLTTDQAKTGKKVSRKQARAGDILVFRVSRSPRGLHTGIYAGDGKFVHSPSSGKRVRLENLKPYWNDKLIAIRRVTK